MKALFLSTYPYGRPTHGGQRRAKAIRKSFELAGFETITFSLHRPDLPMYHGFCPSWQEEHKEFWFGCGPQTMGDIAQTPILEDVLLGKSYNKDSAWFELIKDSLLAFAPNLIILEHPYLWPLVKAILPDKKNTHNIIYSSHNIEHKIKKSIYPNHLSKKETEKWLKNIKSLEQEVCQTALFSIACTESDKKDLIQLGANGVMIMHNGFEQPKAVESPPRLSDENVHSFFVSSAHPPNAQGFYDAFGSSLGWLPPNHNIQIVGSICHEIHSKYLTGVGSGLNASRLNLKGELNDKDTEHLAMGSDLILLPVFHGSGSSLKTLQALSLGRPVIASKFAFRSFEKFLNLSHVSVVETPAEFRSKMLDLISDPIGLRKLKCEVPDDLNNFTWGNLSDQLSEEIVKRVSRVEMVHKREDSFDAKSQLKKFDITKVVDEITMIKNDRSFVLQTYFIIQGKIPNEKTIMSCIKKLKKVNRVDFVQELMSSEEAKSFGFPKFNSNKTSIGRKGRFHNNIIKVLRTPICCLRRKLFR